MTRRRERPLVLGTAVLLTLGSGVWASFTLGSDQVAPETLTTAVGATVEHAGASHAAHAGERLMAGDVLSTGSAGSATLLSPGRRLLLGPGTQVTVGTASGPSYEVRDGDVGLDVESGRRVVLLADAVTATTLTTPTKVRLDRSEGTVRVASLAGGTNVVTTGGANLALGKLDETSALGATLPATPVPVSTIDPSAAGLDAALVPELAQVQGALDRLANQVDADPAAPALFKVSDPDAKPVSTVALPQAIGRAGTVRGSLADRVRRATVLKSLGGAWAVIAAQLEAPVPGVTSALSDLLTPATQVATGPTGPTAGTATAPTSVGSTVASTGRPTTPGRTSPTRGATPSPSSPTGQTPTTSSPTSAPPAPTASPTTPPGLVGGLLGTVTTLLGPVLRPSPSPTS